MAYSAMDIPQQALQKNSGQAAALSAAAAATATQTTVGLPRNIALPRNAVLRLRAQPRRASAEHVQQRSVGLERVISLEKLQSVYERPISKAAAHLNIGITVLKKYCRWYSIERWPYRKIHSIDKLMDQLNDLEANDVVDKVRQELMVIRQQLLCDPALYLDEKVKRLRQAAFKYQYKQRQQP